MARPRTGNTKVRVNLTIDKDIADTLKGYAKEENRTLSNYVTYLLTEFVKDRESK